jgi:molecular chaperone GrpE (heat shock protein)
MKMNDFEKFMRRHMKGPEGEAAAVEAEQDSHETLAEAAAAANVAVSSESEVDRLAREKAELLDRLARLQAEFDNARKRSSREQQEFREYAVASAITPLLPILDSLDRAVHFEDASAADLHAGVELISKQLLAASWACRSSTPTANHSIRTSTRPSKWWKRTKSRTVTSSTNCNRATN